MVTRRHLWPEEGKGKHLVESRGQTGGGTAPRMPLPRAKPASDVGTSVSIGSIEIGIRTLGRGEMESLQAADRVSFSDLTFAIALQLYTPKGLPKETLGA